MAEDIDDLLDEVESKFVIGHGRDANISKPSPARRKAHDSELDQIIDDICGDTRPLENSTTPVRVSKSASKIQALPSKCFPLYVGGSSCAQGFGNSFNRRTCDKMRCTSCDFQVVSFDDFEWHKSVDYLFLRNNVPDFHRLKGKLTTKKGSRAYCCQCTSVSVTTLTDVKEIQTKWVCGNH